MKNIDRYILTQFIVTALFSLVAFVVIFLVVDMMENLDDFLDRKAEVSIIVKYYFYFMPEIIKLIIPVAMLMSALFTTGRLSTFNELTALKSSGLSLYRFMAPLLIFSLFVSAISVYFNGWIVPFANKQKFTISRVYFQKHLEYVSKHNIFIQDGEHRILAIGAFDDVRKVASNVSIQDFDPTNLIRLLARYDAREMSWEQQTRTWTLRDGTKRIITDSLESVVPFDSLSMGPLNFIPEDIEKKQQKPDELVYSDLRQFIENQHRAGHDVSQWLVDLYGKISFPFANFIVVLFGVPFSSVKRRSGLGVEFGIAIGICFFYMIFLKVSQAFGYNGDLDPLLTAWLANIIFFIAGIYVLWRVPK